MKARLVTVRGDGGIPLWSIPPLFENYPDNNPILRLEPGDLAILLMKCRNGSSLLVYQGEVCWAATCCLETVRPPRKRRRKRRS